MSVINTMLKDLESRGAAGEAEREPVLQGLHSMHKPVSRRSTTLLVGAAGALSTVALLYAAYLLLPYRLVSAIDAEADVANVPALQAANERKPQARVADAAQQQAVTAEPSAVAAVETDTPAPPAAAAAAEPAQSTAPAISTAQLADPSPAQDAPAASQSGKAPTPEAEPAQHTATAQHSAASQPADTPPTKPVRLAAAEVSADMMVAQQEGDDNDSRLIVTKKQRALTEREKSTQQFALGLQHYEQGDRQQAKAALREALGHDAANVAARRLLAGIHLESGLPQLAQETIEAGLPKSGNDRELMELYLQVQVKLGNFARAIEVMQQLRPATPDEFGYLAGLYQKNDDHRNAVNYYSRALQLKPNQGVWWMGQGISLESLGKYDEALQSYRQSVNAGRLNARLTEFVANRVLTIERKIKAQDS